MALVVAKRPFLTLYELLRRGQALQFGPLALMRTKHLQNLLLRLKSAENTAAEAGLTAVLPLDLPTLPDTSRDGRRSVMFLHHSYYNFFYLARALRRRGWDAVSVNTEDPNGPHARYYHGEDINLYDPDPERYRRNLLDFFTEAETRFRMVHFYGRGHMSFFPERFDNGSSYDVLPTDFIRLKQRGIRIGYSVCGCLDGVAQSTVKAWSGVCDRCVWQHQPFICADSTNLAWGHKVHLICDLIATEGFPALDWQGKGEKLFREPLTTALDPEFWRPDLEIPDKYRLPRASGEFIVYHGVGNHETRTREGRSVKGTGAVVAAIERLRGEGVPVRLEFVTDLPSTDVRFIQVQADVIVDQLNHGRYGATAREGMMLGRPTVCYINNNEPPGADRLESIETCPLVSANEASVYEVIKRLLSDAALREATGRAGRAFALKWHSADACAARFEAVYDRLIDGLSPFEKGASATARSVAEPPHGSEHAGR